MRNDDLFEFPCDFAIKVMGKTAADFENTVVQIVRDHCQDINTVTKRASSGGKYQSVTVNIIAQSRTQLDALYTELSQHEQVKKLL